LLPYQNRPYDGAASDVYACGILLYKWLTNHHPFIRDRTDDTDEVIENRILKGEIEFRMTREPGSAGELIWKMLRGDPLRRYTVSFLRKSTNDNESEQGGRL
jgi:serine/threonine protein kinase